MNLRAISGTAARLGAATERTVGGIASAGQLRGSFARWAVVTVPLVVLIGFASGRSVPAGHDNAWYVALAKPPLNPPDWLFPVAWSLLYILLGLAVAIVLNARGARWRWPAVAAFVVEVAGLATWQPLFFGAHRVTLALLLIVALLIWGIVTTVLFGRVRRTAAWLLVPFLAWVGFAAGLANGIRVLNPDAERLAPAGRTSQML